MNSKLYNLKFFLTSLGIHSYACKIDEIIKFAEEDGTEEDYVPDPSYDLFGKNFVGPTNYFEYVFEKGDSIDNLRLFYGLPEEAKILDSSKNPIQSAKPGDAILIPLLDKKTKWRGEEVLYSRASYDIEIIAATLHAEASIVGRQGMVNIFQVIKNRAGISSGNLSESDYKTLSEICLKKTQFSCWNGKQGNKMGFIKEILTKRGPTLWNDAIDIVRNNESSTNVGNSTYYIANFLWKQFEDDRAAKLEAAKEAFEKGEKKNMDIEESSVQKSWLDCFEEFYDEGSHKFGCWKKTCYPMYPCKN